MHNKLRIFIFSFCFVGVSSCGGIKEPKQQTPVTEFEFELEKALKNKDYRLYASSGRRLIVPGIEQTLVTRVEEVCGLRYLDGTSDAVHNEQQAELRQQKIAFMAAFNQAMIEYCFSNI